MMKYFLTVLIVYCVGVKSSCQTSNGNYGITGVDVRTANPFWKNYSEEVKTKALQDIRVAISRNITNLSLLEYAFVIDQLCALLKTDTMRVKWSTYINSLNKRDPLMQLSADFFKSTIKLNSYLQKDFSDSFSFIKESLDALPIFILDDKRLDSLITYRGFSETINEGKIFDLLVINNASVLKVIALNQKLKSRYETWLSNLADDAYGFWFSEDRPSQMFTRERQFLISKLKERSDPLSQKSAAAITEMVIVRIHPNKNGYPLGYPDNPTDSDLLTGTWFGPYSENKKIIFRILKLEGNKIYAQSKMQGQDDTQLVSCEGDYFEVEKKFKLTLKEPENGKPFNGIFELTIDRFTLEMLGKWSSYNKQLSRAFQIKKNPLVPER